LSGSLDDDELQIVEILGLLLVKLPCPEMLTRRAARLTPARRRDGDRSGPVAAAPVSLPRVSTFLVHESDLVAGSALLAGARKLAGSRR
jgi:hypothetical protein